MLAPRRGSAGACGGVTRRPARCAQQDKGAGEAVDESPTSPEVRAALAELAELQRRASLGKPSRSVGAFFSKLRLSGRDRGAAPGADDGLVKRGQSASAAFHTGAARLEGCNPWGGTLVHL